MQAVPYNVNLMTLSISAGWSDTVNIKYQADNSKGESVTPTSRELQLQSVTAHQLPATLSGCNS